MLESVLESLTTACELDKSCPSVIGVSGGPDSLCLLDILHRLGYRLVVAHVNHQLRPEAEAEMLLVQQAAEQRNLPFYSHKVEVLPHAEAARLPVEAAARELRYRFLFEIAQAKSAQAVVVGHNADDQVETVLMHLLWGSGLSGLRGMPVRALPNAWSESIPLVRPLLGTWRHEIEAYCTAQGLNPVYDASNQNIAYTRNRLRHELIPLLESYQPGLRQRILRMTDLLGCEDDLLNTYTEIFWVSCLVRQGEGWEALNRQVFLGLPLPVQRRLLRKAVARLRPGLNDLTYEDIQRALAFIWQPTQTRQVDWMGGLRLALEGNVLWLAKWEADLPQADWPQVQGKEWRVMRLPGQAVLPGGWVLRVQRVELSETTLLKALTNPDPYQVWLDGDRLTWPLVVRACQAQDIFQPLGMHGQGIELKNWMNKHKLPRRGRAGWPLVCSGEAIVWIPGYQPSHLARITPETRLVLHLSLKKR